MLTSQDRSALSSLSSVGLGIAALHERRQRNEGLWFGWRFCQVARALRTALVLRVLHWSALHGCGLELLVQMLVPPCHLHYGRHD
jgi:hypothetical protein